MGIGHLGQVEAQTGEDRLDLPAQAQCMLKGAGRMDGDLRRGSGPRRRVVTRWGRVRFVLQRASRRPRR
jgi:hypothetical protein